MPEIGSGQSYSECVLAMRKRFYTLAMMRRCTDIMLKLCEVVPQKLSPPIHQQGCASLRPKYNDNRPYPEMGNCDCQPISADFTDEYKAKMFDRVREILYSKPE